MDPLSSMQQWAGTTASAAVFPNGEMVTHGPTDHRYELASITKLYTALAALVAHEEGTLDLDTPLGDGFTTADLLAHTAGIAPDDRRSLADPRTRRIYSTAAYEMVADVIAERAGMPFETYAHEAVAAPLGTTLQLEGSPGAGATGTVDDVVRLAIEWRTPTRIAPVTHTRATIPYAAGLGGVLPGFGTHNPNPWGLGPEIRGDKAPHWTSEHNSPSTYGHFGRTGTMVWIDPVVDTILVALSDQGFGDWAVKAWPVLSSDVLAAAT